MEQTEPDPNDGLGDVAKAQTFQGQFLNIFHKIDQYYKHFVRISFWLYYRWLRFETKSIP